MDGLSRRVPAGAAVAVGALLLGLAALAAGCGGEPGAASGVSAGQTGERGSPKMSLNLKIEPRAAAFIVGESIDLEVELANTGTAAIEVHSPDEPTAFEYVLHDPAGQAADRVVSFRRATLSRSNDPVPLKPEMTPLEPGQHLTYPDDLADHIVNPVPPGDYLLSATYTRGEERAESEPVSVSIVAPSVTALALSTRPRRRRLESVFVHASEQGEVLFHRVGAVDAPRDGVARRRLEPGSPPVAGVALAVSAGEDDAVGWFAWLQGDAVAAGMGENRSLFFSVDPATTGLSDAVLHPIGLELTPDAAQFALLGGDANGQSALALVTFDAVEQAASVRRVGLGVTHPATAWAIRFGSSADAAVQVVVAEPQGDGFRLSQVMVGPSAEGGAPVSLLEAEGPLLALSLDATGGDPAAVDVIAGPVGAPPRMRYVRQPLDGGPPLAELEFVPPADPAGNAADRWALSPTSASAPALIARLGSQIVGRALVEGGTTYVVADGVAGADNLRLVIVRGKLWAVWTDTTGFHYKQLP